ncbi:MAG: ECF transporter S component [Epulopiscium sp. Nele67-Bin005]|nr:MAG: ECF transporter S component [Epulopiscium sp. Nele67-Bin005]
MIKSKLKDTKYLTLLGIFLAIEIILASTPLGFVPLGFTKATTVHIPVIIGAITLGPLAGMILGAAFGISSIIVSTVTPSLTAFVFSPFVTIGGVRGNIFSLVIALVPRILIGVTAYFSYKATLKITKKNTVAYATAGVVGSMTNTILVMSLIYTFFGEQYAAAREIEFEALFALIMSIVGINGVPEAIVAGIIVTLVCTALGKVFKNKF